MKLFDIIQKKKEKVMSIEQTKATDLILKKTPATRRGA